MLQLHKESVKYPPPPPPKKKKKRRQITTTNTDRQINKKAEKQESRIKKHNNNNNNKYTNLHTIKSKLFSIAHILHRRYYLAIAQITSARKAYIFCLFGITIKWFHMANIKQGIKTSMVVTKK